MSFKSIEITNPSALKTSPATGGHLYAGFSTVDSANPGSKLYDIALIRQDLINRFNTRKGSRVMNPTFGTSLWDYLMEPMSENITTALQTEITAVCTSDPRINPTKINLTEYTDGYLLELTVNIVGTNQAANIILSFDQNLGLVSAVQ
jgi:phage baseplate assembly protein W